MEADPSRTILDAQVRLGCRDEAKGRQQRGESL